MKWSLENIDRVRQAENENELWGLYGVLKDLALFRNWDFQSTIIAFSDSKILKITEEGKVD